MPDFFFEIIFNQSERDRIYVLSQFGFINRSSVKASVIDQIRHYYPATL